jgi:hypothetical protein
LSDIGRPSLTIEPATWTVAAPAAASVTAAAICAGDFKATPLLADGDSPQPASAAAASAKASATAGEKADGDGSRGRIAEQTVTRRQVS